MKYVLYYRHDGQFDTTTVYDSHDEAKDDVAELGDVIVAPLVFQTDLHIPPWRNSL